MLQVSGLSVVHYLDPRVSAARFEQSIEDNGRVARSSKAHGPEEAMGFFSKPCEVVAGGCPEESREFRLGQREDIDGGCSQGLRSFGVPVLGRSATLTSSATGASAPVT